jgi:hypothetical protein
LAAWIADGRPASFTNVVLTVDDVPTPYSDLADVLAGDGSFDAHTGDIGVIILVSYAEGSETPLFRYLVGGA